MFKKVRKSWWLASLSQGPAFGPCGKRSLSRKPPAGCPPQTRATLENPEPGVRRKSLPPSKFPSRVSAANPCQARNSPSFGESSCLARICPFAKSRRVFHPFSSRRVSLRLISRLSRESRAAAPPQTRATLENLLHFHSHPRKSRLFPSLPAAAGTPTGSKFAVFWRIFVPGSSLPLREIPTRFPAIIPPGEPSPHQPTLAKIPSRGPAANPRYPRKSRPFSFPSLPACGPPDTLENPEPVLTLQIRARLEIRRLLANLRAWLEFAPSRNPDAFPPPFSSRRARLAS